MNHPVITKEELLKAAEEIAREGGLERLNMRTVAVACNISVGCIYNYYSSKQELVFALVNRFWESIFLDRDYGDNSENNFLHFVEELFRAMEKQTEGFAPELLGEISAITFKEARYRKRLEEVYWMNIRNKMLKVLSLDQNIREDAWSQEITKESFAEFVFLNIVTAFQSREKNIRLLQVMIERSIYQSR